MIHALGNIQTWLSLMVLSLLEIILGIDNLLFLTIVSGRLPLEQQAAARRIGLMLAMIMRLLLLAFAFLLISMTRPLFSIFDWHVSIRDLFLIFGGGFLLWKSIVEMRRDCLSVVDLPTTTMTSSFIAVVSQIVLLDMVFSIDSVLTAVGIAKHYWVMATAIVIAVLFMLVASNYLSKVLQRYPRIRQLALCFLILIALILMVEGLGIHVAKSYIFVAFTFALFVEVIHIIYDKYATHS